MLFIKHIIHVKKWLPYAGSHLGSFYDFAVLNLNGMMLLLVQQQDQSYLSAPLAFSEEGAPD